MKQEEMRGTRSLAEEVTEILRKRILHGEYSMGEKLTENTIAVELKVSRTPIRDAFRQLEQEQLVEYIPNKGCFARGFGKEDMKDIYAVRTAVEELAIRRAISCGDTRSIRQLEEQLEKMRLYTQQNNYEKLLQANEEFHLMIYRMTESRFIVQTMRTYQEYVQLARKEALKNERYMSEIYQEHEALYRAIEARDEATAVEAARTHLKNSARRAMDRWGADEPY